MGYDAEGMHFIWMKENLRNHKVVQILPMFFQKQRNQQKNTNMYDFKTRYIVTQ